MISGNDNKGYNSSHDNVYETIDMEHLNSPDKKETKENHVSIPLSYEKRNEDGNIIYNQEDFDDLPQDDLDCLGQAIGKVQDALSRFCHANKRYVRYAILIFFGVAYLAYFIWANICKFESEDDIRLVWLTGAVIFFIVVHLINKYAGRKLYEALIKPVFVFVSRHWKIFLGIFIAVVLGLIVFFLIYVVALKEPYNLVSISGIVVYILLGYIFSHNPKMVKWRPILVGLLLQFVFALLILRTKPGLDVFKFLGNRVEEFLNHADAGSKFVFGDKFTDHFFAFKILPVIVFFSCAISTLYYLGFMQMVIQKVAWVMWKTMGTTAAESLNAAGNIFVGQSESPLMIRPLVGRMTNSELHSVMTSGYATIAGTVLAAYVQFGVPADHLLSASVMSAPAALAIAKLFYPETKMSKTTFKDVKKMAPSPYKNIIAAISGGASESISLVANIAVNLLAFLSVLQFVNATLKWFGDRACLAEPLTFQFICSYLLWPLAFVMGVEPNDCRKVAELIGIKTFLNEFIAYEELGKLIKNRQIYDTYNMSTTSMDIQGSDIFLKDETRNSTLINGFLSDRSEVIATYTLCGFANCGSIGIMLSALGAMAPHRRNDLSKIVIRALIAGNVACFITACIAGLLYETPSKV